MILNTSLLLLLNIAWMKYVSGASFSKVFMHSGPEIGPAVQYIGYDAPSVSYSSPYLAQYAASHKNTVIPLASNYAELCGSACLYSGPTYGSVAPITSSSNIVAYNSPAASLPVVYSPAANEPTGYQYSYLIYDDYSRRYNAQNVVSDGAVVRGEYTFLQPNGLAREVQYIAEDSQGLNAIIVKNILPAALTESLVEHVSTRYTPPCPEVHNGPLIAAHSHEEHESREKSLGGDHVEAYEHGEQDAHEESHENRRIEHEGGYEAHEADKVNETHEKSSEIYEEHESGHVAPEEERDARERNHEGHEEHDSAHNEHEEGHEFSEINHEEHSVPESHNVLEENNAPPNENQIAHETHDAQHGVRDVPPEEHVTHGAYEVSKHGETSHENIELIHEGHHGGHEVDQVTHQAATAEHVESNIVVPYNDIIRCIQAAVNKIQDTPTHVPESPLTYLVFNKPC